MDRIEESRSTDEAIASDMKCFADVNELDDNGLNTRESSLVHDSG